MENEHVYHTAVLDRQKRQFRKSLELLEKDRRAVKRYYDRGGNWVATPLKVVEGFSRKRNRPAGDLHDHLPPILDAVEAVHEANSEHHSDRGKAADPTAVQENAGKRTARAGPGDGDHLGHLPNILRRNLTMPAGSDPNSDSIPKPPQRFYTGDDMNSLKEHLKSQESHHSRDNPQTVTVQSKDLSIPYDNLSIITCKLFEYFTQGRIQDFHLGRGRKRLCARDIRARNPKFLSAGIQGPLKGPASSRFFECSLDSAIWYKMGYKKNHSRSRF